MKFSINSKYKLWIIITVAVLLVGFVLLAVFGFNQTPDYKASKEVVVTMDNQLDATIEEFETISNKYLSNAGIKVYDYATKKLDGPIGKYSIIYKVDADVVNAKQMEAYVNSELQKLNHNEVNVEVAFNDLVKPFEDSQIGWICLAIGLTAIAVFVYLFFMEKIASALSVLASSFMATLLFIAIVGGARIPAEPFVGAVGALTFALSSFLSTGMVSRFKEEIKINESRESKKDKLSFREIADKSAIDSLLRYAFVLCAVAVAGIVMIAIGSAYVKFLGIQLIVAGISAVFASFIGVPLLWPVLKNFKK